MELEPEVPESPIGIHRVSIYLYHLYHCHHNEASWLTLVQVLVQMEVRNHPTNVCNACLPFLDATYSMSEALHQGNGAIIMSSHNQISSDEK